MFPERVILNPQPLLVHSLGSGHPASVWDLSSDFFNAFYTEATAPFHFLNRCSTISNILCAVISDKIYKCSVSYFDSYVKVFSYRIVFLRSTENLNKMNKNTVEKIDCEALEPLKIAVDRKSLSYPPLLKLLNKK